MFDRQKKINFFLGFSILFVCWALARFYSEQDLEERQRSDFQRFNSPVIKRITSKPISIQEEEIKEKVFETVQKPIKEVERSSYGGSDVRFKALCKVFLQKNLGDDDLLVDAKSHHYQKVGVMFKQVSRIRMSYEKLLKDTQDLDKNDVCAVNEMERYLTTLMESLKYHQLSREMKRKFIMMIFNISSLFTKNGHEGFTLFMMYKLIENGLVGQEFIPEVSRLQRDHNIYMEVKYSGLSQEDIQTEKARLKSDISALVLLITRTLF